MGSSLNPNFEIYYPEKILKNKDILEKARRIYKDEGYWKRGDEVKYVSYHERENCSPPSNNGKWYKIHCINNRKENHFISLEKKDFENYKYKIKKPISISETKKLIKKQIIKLEKVKKGLNQKLENINDKITKFGVKYQKL